MLQLSDRLCFASGRSSVLPYSSQVLCFSPVQIPFVPACAHRRHAPAARAAALRRQRPRRLASSSNDPICIPPLARFDAAPFRRSCLCIPQARTSGKGSALPEPFQTPCPHQCKFHSCLLLHTAGAHRRQGHRPVGAGDPGIRQVRCRCGDAARRRKARTCAPHVGGLSAGRCHGANQSAGKSALHCKRLLGPSSSLTWPCAAETMICSQGQGSPVLTA